MSDDAWRGSYDAWKTTDPNDRWSDEVEDGCTCPLELGAGGTRMTDQWCAIHGLDPDAEYDRMRDERDGL